MKSFNPTKCPICNKNQSLGNSFNTSKGYICIECIKQLNLSMKVAHEEKDLRCFICSEELTCSNFMITPTILICTNCKDKYSQSELFFSGSKNEILREGQITFAFIFLLAILYIISSVPILYKANPLILSLGSFYPMMIDHGEYWRIITGNLLHVDMNHLFFNSIGILICGYFLEKLIGRKSLFILIVLSALFTDFFSYYLAPDKISVGSSGIAYGLLFAFVIYIAFLTIIKKPQELKGQLFSIMILLIFQILENFQYANIVNMYAHLGGAIGGIVFIFVYIFFNLKKLNKQSLL